MVSATYLEIKQPVENSSLFQREVLVSDPGEQGKLKDIKLHFAENWH